MDHSSQLNPKQGATLNSRRNSQAQSDVGAPEHFLAKLCPGGKVDAIGHFAESPCGFYAAVSLRGKQVLTMVHESALNG